MAVFLSQSTWGYYTQSPLVPLSFTGLAEFDTKSLHLKIQSVEIRKIYKRLLQMLQVDFTEHQHQHCYFGNHWTLGTALRKKS